MESFKLWLENARTLYFLRLTRSPQNDLLRGWSCHAEAWTDSKESAFEIYERIKHKRAAALPPQMDQQYHGTNPDGSRYERWCYWVEPGLSSYAFWDEQSFERAKRKIEYYAESPMARLHVFQSDKYKLRAGSDGEDVFSPGIHIKQITFQTSWRELGVTPAIH